MDRNLEKIGFLSNTYWRILRTSFTLRSPRTCVFVMLGMVAAKPNATFTDFRGKSEFVPNKRRNL